MKKQHMRVLDQHSIESYSRVIVHGLDEAVRLGVACRLRTWNVIEARGFGADDMIGQHRRSEERVARPIMHGLAHAGMLEHARRAQAGVGGEEAGQAQPRAQVKPELVAPEPEARARRERGDGGRRVLLDHAHEVRPRVEVRGRGCLVRVDDGSTPHEDGLLQVRALGPRRQCA